MWEVVYGFVNVVPYIYISVVNNFFETFLT